MTADCTGAFVIAYGVRMDLDCGYEGQALKT